MTYLQIWSRGKGVVRKEICEFGSALDLISLVLAACSKNGRDTLEVPLLDVVVAGVPSMDIPLDCISFIAKDKTIPVSI